MRGGVRGARAWAEAKAPPSTAAPDRARPRLVVSACLEYEPCRYNGQSIRARFLRRLEPHVELVRVCPEVEIGLGVPRPPIRLVRLDGEDRLIQPETERDLTAEMEGFSARYLEGLGEVDGFLLKSRSPSCGPKDVKVYMGDRPAERGSGLFAAAVQERFPEVALEDEGRLTNHRLRHHYLTRVFGAAALRAVEPTIPALMRFHARNKLLLLVHSESGMRSLGRLLANHERRSEDEVVAGYRAGFAHALSRPPKPGAVVNALHHALGFFSDDLQAGEKQVFLHAVEGFVLGRNTAHAPQALLQAWLARYDRPYLADQTLFRPYPEGLEDMSDSAR